MKKISFRHSFFVRSFVIVFLLSLVSCSLDDANSNNNTEPTVIETSLGMFIVNEGNYYNGINGSLSYLGYSTETVTDSVFMKANGYSLGATPNDIIIFDDRVFIPVTDDNIVWELDARSMRVVGKFTIPSPRKLVGAGENIYVTSYNGKVYCISIYSETVTESAVVGGCLEDITYCNGYLYVCNAYHTDYTYNTNLIKMDTNLNKVKDITVASNPSQLETDNINVYLCSYGNYDDVKAQVQRIDEDDKVEVIGNGAIMSYGYGMVYFIDTDNMKYYKYDIETGQTTTFTTGNRIDYPAFISVDPTDGEVFIGAYHFMEGSSWGDYNSPGYMVEYKADGTYVSTYNLGISPRCAAHLCYWTWQ